MEVETMPPKSVVYLNDILNGVEDEFEEETQAAKMYERSRIRALADEREYVQKKTFTKWINSHLMKVSSHVDELYMDLRDGKLLLTLLEILSGERLPRPTRGKMRIHSLENVDKSLNFLNEQHVHLENMGAHDIVDGSSRLTLGLIWTIILRFQIQDIQVELPSGEAAEAKSAKDALLLWCQMKTAGYLNCNVRNFTTSWKDGFAFNALIHKHRPDVIDYSKLSKATPIENLSNAFMAASNLGITRLLDPEDVNVDTPDEKSIMTYVVSYYHFFNKLKADTVHAKRIAKIVNGALETENMIINYEKMASDLLVWIQKTISVLDERSFANSLPGVQRQLGAFSTYRTIEKPPKFTEKGNLEILLFTIQSRLRASNQRSYQPTEKLYISNVNRAWDSLEKAEHERELALRDELIRQEKLEQLANRFKRKAGMRELWLSENQRLVANDNFGDDLAAVEAATKKHEAIETDILAYEERVNAVVLVAQKLFDENYYDISNILSRNENVEQLWSFLLDLLKARRSRLELSRRLHHDFQEMQYLLDWIDEIKSRLLSGDYGKHLMGVEDLIQKHTLIEAEIKVVGARIAKALEESQYFVDCEFPTEVGDYKPCEPELVRQRGEHLRREYEAIKGISNDRKDQLNQFREMWQFFWDVADEEQWIKEKEQLMSSPDLGHDIGSVNRLLRKHKAFDEDLLNRQSTLNQSLAIGEDLIKAGNIGKDNLRNRMTHIHKIMEDLMENTNGRKQKLLESQHFLQFMAECDDASAWMSEIMRQVSSEDVGTKLAITESLIKKQNEIVENIEKFKDTIQQLHNIGEEVGAYLICDVDKINDRLDGIDQQYKELCETSNRRHQRLQDALSMYKVFTVTDTVHTWITEKEKLLTTLAPTDEFEELAVLRTRFDYLESEMTKQADRVKDVNERSELLVQHEHPNADNIDQQKKDLNVSWNELADIVDAKRKDLQTALLYQEYFINCKETENWIHEKAKLIESTDSLSNDLEGIMQLQRRLGGLQRDLNVLQSKIDDLDEKASTLVEDRPDDKASIEKERDDLHSLWADLKDMLKVRDERLSDSSDLQRFLQDLDHFQMWLRRTQTAVASEDIPKDLDDAEKLGKDHAQICDEIASYEPEFLRLMEFGRHVTQDKTDRQYLLLSERLDGLQDGWDALEKMKIDRESFLKECYLAQLFFRDALQVDVILSKQEVFLAKEDVPVTLDGVKNAIKEHEIFMSSMEACDEKMNKVLATGVDHIDQKIFQCERIKTKCDNVVERRSSLKVKADERMKQLKDALVLHEFIQEIDDEEEWIAEKMITCQDDGYRDVKDLATRYSRFRAFEDELAANKDKIDNVIQTGELMTVDYPKFEAAIEPRVKLLQAQWYDLDRLAREKSARLADSNREKLFDETAKNMSSWLTEMSQQIITEESETEEIISLVEINKKQDDQLKKHRDMDEKKKQLQDLETHAVKLKEQYPEREQEFERVQQEVRTRIIQLEAPLMRRTQNIERKKRVGQLLRDLEDEKQWCRDKLRQLDTDDVGDNLLAVQQMLRRLRHLKTEIENHAPQRDIVYADVDAIIAEGHPRSQDFEDSCTELHDLWEKLEHALSERHAKLNANEYVQNYLFDASEAEAWMDEQELYLMGDEKAKDEQGANNAIKKHEQLQESIDHYGEEVRTLGSRAHTLNEQDDIPLVQKNLINSRQARVDRMYAGLNELGKERRLRLEETLKMFHLLKEIVDLEAWIAERCLVASSHELGNDYEHCCLLRERFTEFTRDTKETGKHRVGAANELCDALIDQGHGEAAEIAQWKDRINEAWADLLELMETRTQLLKIAWDLHKYLCDSQDVLERIKEKEISIPEGTGKNAKAVTALQRKHETFEIELQRLSQQVGEVVESASHLLPSYAGDKERLIIDRREDVIAAWQRLKAMNDQRKLMLSDTADFYRFMAMVRELRLWMEGMRNEMDANELPRDVSGVELLINSHRSLKAELDAREENFSICLTLGRTLLYRGHSRQSQIREKCIELVTERQNLQDRWADRWEQLSLLLEVYQFARDAAVAESWLISQETYLTNRNLGDTLDDTLALLKKHIAFERAAGLQEERFSALKKLTTFELRERERTPETEAARRRERERRIQEAIKEFMPPPTTPQIVKHPKVSPVETVPAPAVATPISRGHSESSEPTEETTPRSFRGRERGHSKDAPDSGKPSEMEGTLSRKHEWQEENKKASGRSWHELYITLNSEQGLLCAHKDQRHAKDRPLEYYHREPPIKLSGSAAAPATDYSKRANVFRLKLPNGGEYLFQTRTENEMHNWLMALNAAARGSKQTSPETARHKSSTLPSGSSTSQQQQQKKKKIFTLRGK